MSVQQVLDASLPLSTPLPIFVTNFGRHLVCEVTHILNAENRVICLLHSLRIPILNSSWQKHVPNKTEVNLRDKKV